MRRLRLGRTLGRATRSGRRHRTDGTPQPDVVRASRGLCLYGRVAMLTRLASRAIAPLIWPALQRRGEQTDWRDRWVPQPAAPVALWIHTASLGEIAPYTALLHELDLPIGITVTSGRSLAAVQERFNAIADVRPLPLPGSPAMAHLIADWRPRRLILLEADAWPDLLAAVPKPIPELAVLGGRVNRLTAALWRRHVTHIPTTALSGIWTGTNSQAAAWRRCGIPQQYIHTGYEPKLCAALPVSPPDEFQTLRHHAHLTVAGSLHPDELETVLNGWSQWRRTQSDARLVLVPRHPERLAEFTAQLNGRDAAVWPAHAEVIVIARYGVLAGLYELADAAIVGGSWNGRGGHNPLEAALHGIPVVMGPSVHNQKRLIELLGEQIVIAPTPETIASALARQATGTCDLESVRQQMMTIAREALRLP
ncbi:MAG: hypothetical protein D6761_06655 [Candidatus Dadabacteria bacterium]|nr:MAG: hypothetical protein D6761_06655 [Candidatus Dadabacteria bacterium]